MDDRRPAGQPEDGDASPMHPPVSWAPPPAAWGPPPGTSAPVSWGTADGPAAPAPAGTVYAGVGVRFMAWLLDLIPLLILGGVVFAPVIGDLVTAIVAALPERPRPGQTSFPEVEAAMTEAIAAATPGIVRASALFQLGALVYLAGSWLTFSRSPGMALLGIRIVREDDGGPMGPGRVAIRFGGYYLSTIALLLGFAWALFDGRKQAWHDKLAGTVVVRTVPTEEPRVWTSQSGWSSPTAETPMPAELPASTVGRRPSIGAIAERAWSTFRRAPLEIFTSLALVLIPTMIVLLPVIGLYLIVAQDQLVVSFRLIGDAIDPNSFPDFVEYNRRLLESAAPAVLIGAAAAILGSLAGSLVIGAAAAATDDSGALRPAGAVTRAILDSLPALLVLGAGGGIIFAVQVVLSGLPALSAASADPATFDPDRALVGGLFGGVVLLPVTLYCGAIWLLAVVCVVAENLGPVAAIRRAWTLSRGRMLWLIGLSLAAGLAVYTTLGPIGLLPLGVFAEDYVGGGRLPAAISVLIFGVIAVVVTPLLGLFYAEAYRAARDDAAATGA